MGYEVEFHEKSLIFHFGEGIGLANIHRIETPPLA